MPGLQLCFALHDVTPFHRGRLERAEALFVKWGIRKVLYLLVPNYHALFPADRDEAFREWCLAPRPFEVQWFQHGYFHLAVPAAAACDPEAPAGADGSVPRRPGNPRADEGEFGGLTIAAARERVERGRDVFRRCLGFAPQGFVAPKWIGDETLVRTLEDLGFSWTEDRAGVLHVGSGVRFRAPVVTWATRSWWRKRVSLWGSPFYAAALRGAPLLRIAVHPFDFDHPAVVDVIARVVAGALERRSQVFYAELPAAAAAGPGGSPS